VLLANNIQDSPGLAWNDSISAHTSTDSSATVSDSYVLVPANLFHAMIAGERSITAPTKLQVKSLAIEVSLYVAGMHFAMTTQGDFISSMLINSGFPIVRLNNFLTIAIMPIIVSYGTWRTCFGFRDSRVDTKVVLSKENGSLSLSQASMITSQASSSNCTKLVSSFSSWFLPA